MNKFVKTYLSKEKNLTAEKIQEICKKIGVEPQDKLTNELIEKIEKELKKETGKKTKIKIKKKKIIKEKIIIDTPVAAVKKEENKEPTSQKISEKSISKATEKNISPAKTVISEKKDEKISVEEKKSSRSINKADELKKEDKIKKDDKKEIKKEKTESETKKETIISTKEAGLKFKYEPKTSTQQKLPRKKHEAKRRIYIKKKKVSSGYSKDNKSNLKKGSERFKQQIFKDNTAASTATQQKAKKKSFQPSDKRKWQKDKDIERKSKEIELDKKLERFEEKKKKQEQEVKFAIPEEIEISDTITVSELARKMNIKVTYIIKKFMDLGQMVTINQVIDADTAEIIASEFNCKVKRVSILDEVKIPEQQGIKPVLKPRAPIVTVMGHVDHGKTTLLDFIRKTKVAQTEAGGITQRIGAYKVNTPNGNIVFIDTPGHAAFTNMRARGARVTDIVVLVVAADDGVMPQTVEAINHAKEAGVPIIVAVNKIDKPNANPEKVKSDLSEYNIIPQEWGGENVFVNVSALKGIGIDELLEAILLVSEELDLKADFNPQKWAEGIILEAKIDKGRGVVATVITKNGVAKLRDFFIAGNEYGRIRIMTDENGNRLKEVYPSTPVEIVGFEGLPAAGDPFNVVENEKMAREISNKRKELERMKKKGESTISLENIFQKIEDGEVKELKIIIKADVQGMAEALKTALEKLSVKNIKVKVIHSSVGAISENDVNLASASKAIIIGFNTKPTTRANQLAEQMNIELRRYAVIYDVIDDVKKAITGLARPKIREEILGEAEVRKVFKVSGVGTVAGCYVTKGIITRNGLCRIFRDGTKIYESKIASLYRFKDPVKEVKQGFECGLTIANFQDIKENDVIEVFQKVEENYSFEELAAMEKEKNNNNENK